MLGNSAWGLQIDFVSPAVLFSVLSLSPSEEQFRSPYNLCRCSSWLRQHLSADSGAIGPIPALALLLAEPP